MTTPLPRLSITLVPAVLLAWATQQAHAQTTLPPGRPANAWSPSFDDPTYAARKRQRAAARPVAAPQPARQAASPSGGPAAITLPACFEPLDTTATGGWQHFPRLDGYDDAYIGPIALGFNFSLYGNVYNQVYVNSNGNISFGQGFTTFTATGFPTAVPMIAPFWADVDVEMDDTTAIHNSGNIFFKKFPDKFVVTWNRVAYFARHADKKNTFQLVIKANTAPGFTGDDVFFSYGDMQWTTGDADSGQGGFGFGVGGTPATVGVNKGDGTSFIQVGRFSKNDSSHPNNQDESGVNWLDNQCFSFRVGSVSTNAQPTAAGLPAGNTITLSVGQTRNLTLQFLGPETGQTVSVATNTNGLCNTTVANDGTANPTVNLSITGAACNVGTHTISLLATDNGTPVASQQFDLTVVVLASNQWTGAVSSVYTNPANWSAGTVPTATDDVTIPAGVPNMPVLSTTAAVNNLTIASGANLTVASGGVFTLGGNLTNNGLLLGAGTLQTNGAATQTFSGTGNASLYRATIGAAGAVLNQPLALDQLLTLNGNLQSNGNLTLHSRIDGSETAMVVNNGSAAVTGNVTVERFIGPTTSPQMGYRHLAPPVTNTTLADMTIGGGGFSPVTNAAYNTSPNPGSVTPFPNVFSYDETRVTSGAAVADFDKGWVSPVTTSLLPTFGLTVNMMGRQIMDFVGTLGNGTFNRTNLTRGTGSQAGWHLLGNPYPAPIDFTQLTRTGLDNAVYVFRSSGQYAGSYASYVNGVPANGGSNILPMGQAFFVRTSVPGVAGSMAFTNAARLTTYQNPGLQRTTAETRPLLRLTLANAAGSAADEMAVYFEQGATAGFDSGYDAYRLGNGNAVQLGAVAGAAELSISGLPALSTAPVTVPLLVRVAQSGTYTLRAEQLLNLPAGWTATLRDALTGAAIDLQQQPTYSCAIAANEAPGRFSVDVAPRVTSASQAQLAATVSVYPNPARGLVSLGLPATQQPVTVSVLNALGQQVLTQRVPATGRGTAVALPLTNLAKGVYSVRVALPEGTVTKRLVVE
ncbi:T9SS type A sorting domain-containing protein [Hymenobacter sp. 15J16-1T3B]|uniref:nidogen-like domain-containing protein n=1 Tax=Hymenobacter sp. 15J16-1T3B TaxID=2886941 RepID=UPI001D118ACF|nr:nidogen-like domain-containing protein [Hymenobacter sp. 15J16-1T3B]MCC3160662.1 T9SS type A sorting domain-containing protein [Hymenobacter sp. 15J16-1T3B]